MARLHLKSPTEVLLEIGHAAAQLRLRRNLTQVDVAERADVSLRTLQRFEKSGNVSMDAAVRIGFALGCEDGFEALFAMPEPESIDEVLEEERPRRKRSRRSK